MLLANENAISSGNYIIGNSLRFQSASSQYLNRTFASSPTTRTKITISVWVKRGQLGTNQMIIDGYDGTSALRTSLFFTTSDTLEFDFGGASAFNIVTTQVFRDPSAWYHIVLQVDTTQATAANRCILYVNGSQVTAYGTANYPAQNATHQFLYGNALNWIGTLTGTTYLFDGYLAEMNVIDGQALTPSSFGTTDPTSGQWVAQKYGGTYGTNGFYLPFSNGTSTTTLGADSSGNGNNWTLTNFTRSAGVSDCWMTDVPSGNGTGPATQPSSNYAVLNPISNNQYASLNGANLDLTTSTTLTGGLNASIGVSSGKWYWEIIVGSVGTPAQAMIGIRNQSANITSASAGFPGGDSNGYGYYASNGQKYTNNSGVAYGATFTSNDVIGVAFDADNGTLTFYKNNVSQGIAFTGISVSGNSWFPALGDGSATLQCSMSANFGQRSFAYTPPTGYKALCTANLPVATIKQGNKYMDATLFTGTGASQAIVNAAGFKPDFVWTKSRNVVDNHYLYDSVRGATIYLSSNTTTADTTNVNSLTAFNSNGFQLGSFYAANNHVGWQWQAGQGTTSSNTSGSITSTVSVNATAGFSVVTYTGNGTNGATFGHGLGVAPSFIIIKTRTGSSTNFWICYHKSLGATSGIYLNRTDAIQTFSDIWNNTAPTSSVVTLGTTANDNTNGNTYVAYCWAEIAGFSKFGSYTGNGSADGVFVYLGFRPKFVMFKQTTAASATNWVIYDSVRNTYNETNLILNPNASSAEATATTVQIDILSNGFKFRGSDATGNGSGATYIYACFAETPFQNSNAR